MTEADSRRRVKREHLFALGAVLLLGGALYASRARGSVRLGDFLEDAVVAVTPGAWAPPERAAPYLVAIEQAERANGIPKNLLARLLYQESRYRDDIITGATASPAGALGIAQFMPATARDFGIDPLNPFAAIPAAGRYLGQLYQRFGNWSDALAAYNFGQGRVARGDPWPAETRSYVDQIMGDVFV